MTLAGIDLTRAVFTHPEREALVRAVFSAPLGESEKDFIEWKSRYDLRSPEDQCKLARHILGFANRDPDRAATAFAGFAYLICGAEPGDVQGVEKLDSADLVQGIGRYTGTAGGPRWDFDYIESQGRDVLVITVERPEWGDPIRTLQKGLGSYQPGAIFVRRHGKTEQADPSEIQMLELRSARHKRQLELDVKWATTPQPVLAVGWDKDDATKWAEREREGMLASLARFHMPRKMGMLPPLLLGAEGRKPEEYETQVERYLKDATETLPIRLLYEGVRRAHQYKVEITNLTDRNFEAVRLELTIEGSVRGYFDLDDARYELGVDQLPTRPRPYGDVQDLLSGFHMPHITPFSRMAQPPVGWIDNSASARIRFADQDLRPHGRTVTASWRLFAGRDLAGQDIAIKWSTTAKNTEGKVDGELRLTVHQDVLGLRDLLDTPKAKKTSSTDRK